MIEEEQRTVSPGRRHIIKRPRLTRLLDETNARVIMLVAPAGYGKTTLAREWLSAPGRRSAWYQATGASRDVAGLAIGIADAAGAATGQATTRVRGRLSESEAPAPGIALLAGLVAADLESLPDEAWLVIDDYHLLIGSEPAEALLEALVALTSVCVLLMSRQRPTWATARRLLYGELHEYGRSVLALTAQEAHDILAPHKTRHQIAHILSLTEGWPAVIGLASLTDDFPSTKYDLTASLYDYFAEELYQKVSPPLQRALCQMAVPPRTSHSLVESLHGKVGLALIQSAVEVGFLSWSGETLELHPLLRTFLERKLFEHPASFVKRTVEDVITYLLDHRRWDEAYATISHFAANDYFEHLIDGAMHDLLAEGRLPTLAEWLTHAKRSTASPVFDLVDAELAFRDGDHARAEAQAVSAVEEFEPSHPRLSQAWTKAGQAAYFLDDSSRALELFSRASACARSDADLRNALWGSFLAASELESAELKGLLAKLLNTGPSTYDEELRLVGARIIYAHRFGSLSKALDLARHAERLVALATDPITRSGFLNYFAHLLACAGEYAEAAEVIEQQLAEASHHKLGFVRSHARLTKAAAELGLRRFGEAERTLDRARTDIATSSNAHLQANIARLEIRLQLETSSGPPYPTLEERTSSPRLNRASLGEYLATLGVAFACRGELDEATRLLTQAGKITTTTGTSALCICCSAIISMHQSRHPNACLSHTFDEVLRTGSIDSFVFAYRGFPPLLRGVAKNTSQLERLTRIVANAHDNTLGRRAGLATKAYPRPSSHLTAREIQVHGLVAKGLSNREIATKLFISEATVKAHMRHIFEKLGVRSRTAVAVHQSRPSDLDRDLFHGD